MERVLVKRTLGENLSVPQAQGMPMAMRIMTVLAKRMLRKSLRHSIIVRSMRGRV
jgi:hypothetical protein